MASSEDAQARWQRLADTAALHLMLDSGQLGLETDISVDVDRCLDVLSQAAARGIVPRSPEALMQWALRVPGWPSLE